MINKQNLVIAALMGASLVLLGNGVYIKAKAELAQWLIAKTWQQRTQHAEPQKPWPWADTKVVAQINVPRLGISQFVMQDASGESLAFGPGAVIPVNDEHYHFIAGHRDTHFSYLDKLQVGDVVEIKSYKGTSVRYQITDSRVVDINNGPLYVDEQSRGLALMTCWPMDSVVPGGPLRYVVSGDVYEM
jgi:sortase A